MKKIFLTIFSVAIIFTFGSLNTQRAEAVTPHVHIFDCKNYVINVNCGSITLYARQNPITGVWSINNTNLGNTYDYNDKASSIQVVGFPTGYQIRFYENEIFGGVYITTFVNHSTEGIPDLSIYWRRNFADGFNNQITSFSNL